MFKKSLAAASALLLMSCAHLPGGGPAGSDNPFLAPSSLPYQLPPFDRITDAHYRPAFTAGMAEQRREIDAIARQTEPPSFANTIEAMERSGQILARVSRVFFALSAADTNPELQAIQAEMAPRLSAHRDAIYLDSALYARVKTLHDQRLRLGLDAEALRLLEETHTAFVRAGAQLAEADKTRLRALNEELSSLSTRFQQNLLKATNAAAVVVSRRAELAGLPESAINAAAEAAKARGMDGQWLISLQNTSGQPALAQLENRALRERLYWASVERANSGEFDNTGVLVRMAQLRAERARLLGYEHHAAYALEDQTARTTEAVNGLLARLAPAAVANARREAADMQKLIRQQGAQYPLAAWDWAYWAERVRKARYDLDVAEARPYFELERVLRDGVFFMAERLYGLRFAERRDLPVYHPDVRVFEVFEADGAPLGLFLFDPFARPSKRGGAWMNALVSQSGLLGTRPVVTNNLNVTKPPAGEPVLLSFDETNTLFHEFGHALHGLFSNVRYPSFAGTSVPRDFVEYPSQVHEMWVLHPEVLANYARHYQSGEPMPAALVKKILAAEQFNQGFATTEYLAAALLDQAWHQIPAGTEIPDALAFEAQALRKAGVAMATVPPRYRSPYFAHIFAGGYSAGYYAYIWSEVLDAESVDWFNENGGLTRANGDHFRAELLSRGGAVDAMTLFRNFRGRNPRIEPLLLRRGLKPVR
jgi:peptidyl-dipeptidase Dcp